MPYFPGPMWPTKCNPFILVWPSIMECFTSLECQFQSDCTFCKFVLIFSFSRTAYRGSRRRREDDRTTVINLFSSFFLLYIWTFSYLCLLNCFFFLYLFVSTETSSSVSSEGTAPQVRPGCLQLPSAAWLLCQSTGGACAGEPPLWCCMGTE